jgi:hypothetical protein
MGTSAIATLRLIPDTDDRERATCSYDTELYSR